MLAANALPPQFQAWFAKRGWTPRDHQLAMLDKARAGRGALLIAPTGGGKTLAGFLPSLIELAERPPRNTPAGVHTLYISPLKALAVDVERNLLTPIREMGLPIVAESRTGDTGESRKARQKVRPPDILLTTPEQLALFCAWEGAREYFSDLRCVIIDEAHAIWPSKRGDLLALGLSRLQQFAPNMRRVGLSATVDDPDLVRKWLGVNRVENPPPRAGEVSAEPTEGASTADLQLALSGPPGHLPRAQGRICEPDIDLVLGAGGAQPVVEVLVSGGRVPWAGHTAEHAMAEVYDIIKAAKTALVFVNTRFQAEFAFQRLWELNDEGLPIALHHGSLSAEQRRKVEAAMARGELRAVVCTSTLDMGIDWGDVDLVIQLAAPKGASRMVQRIGRANHRLDEPSRAIFVPASRFEMLECRAAADAILENHLDGEPPRTGALDVLAQHIMGCACSEPFKPTDLYDEVRSAGPYAELTWEDFEAVVDFVSTGGYALRTYDKFRRIVQIADGLRTARNAQARQQHRMNVGAIISPAMINIRIGGGRKPVGGRKIGEAEEGYFEQLTPGDTFVFAGQVWRYNSLVGADAYVSPAPNDDPKMPSWGGSKFPLSTYLAERVRQMMHDEREWSALPGDVQEWLSWQKIRSAIPAEGEMLLETFPRGKRFHMVCYPFDGRLAHTTLAMLLTRRLDRLGVGPLGFVCNDYALNLWSLRPMDDLDLDELFAQDMLGDDLEAWLDESFMMKRSFKHCALIAGLIERRHPGAEKSGRQVTFSTDLIYDVLRKHQPDHLMLRCARLDAATGLLDIARLGDMLTRVRGRIRHVALDRVSPFAVPMMLEIGRERAPGDAAGEMILAEAEADLIAEARP
ncbi:ligase-associated DNA damage response DEXH box helicase [Caulobacter vibrioides]|uniref:ATP-dependent RNA helicase, DEAD/DEAH family n=2 Tax=Caulobacter vibrioides TaxID=155892 RepID=Q9A6P4_CAUVC|nr:ligase-associated DNA damage response DEXH box helicase [Caulobacter vibrioides]YP_002517494.1 ligase-associated DNA damage response DEXH box helicase [Caulobacter vibrioides NA1000]AAK24015.1 ATP-dependent RNA helicase, DEAD/DEAH family [Caulobacter vibrioides CB15]ACL95586.1 ligase-associated DNA damage response DEXH box helicase [Caulobacter vibrioides NA1000]ATC28912.1 DEAD/DEAH box helicase [Caulobacter vibrioides]QXZ50424.1 ligase-associated DNA damage response DEXH box helicase [Caul